MRYEIWAAEEVFLTEYAECLANASAEERTAAFSLFGEDAKPSIMTISGEEAVIKISGPLSKNGPSPLARYFGYDGAGYLEIADAVLAAAADDKVKTIRLAINSPGGRVIGVEEASLAIASAAAQKPVIAENHGMIASAAYWLASQATKIISTASVNVTGSIGVLATIMDYTDEGLAARGVKRLHIVSDNAPNKTHDISSDALKQEIQREVNSTERVFFSRVAQGRKITVADVREKFGQGGVFIAQDPSGEKPDALSVGMIDELAEGASVKTEAPSQVETTPTTAKTKTKKNGVKKMTLAEFFADNPGAKVEYDAALKTSEQAGREAAAAEFEKRLEAAAPFLASDEYAQAEDVRDAAMQVVKGDLDAAMLKTIVSMHDKMKAMLEVTTAGSEGDESGETQSQQQNTEGEASTYDEILAADKAARGEV
jgi:ClpP class serine protease